MSQYDNTNTGALFSNREKMREGKKDPQLKGSVNVDGVEYWISAWKNTSKAGADYLSLKFTPKQPKPTEAPPMDERKNVAEDDFDDQIPF